MKSKLNIFLFSLILICSFFVIGNVNAASKTPTINLNQINSSAPNYSDYVSLLNRYKNNYSETYPYYFTVLTDSDLNNTLSSSDTTSYKYIMFLFGDKDSAVLDLNVKNLSSAFNINLILYSSKTSSQRLVSINSLVSGITFINQSTTFNGSDYYMNRISKKDISLSSTFDIYIDTNLPTLTNCYISPYDVSNYVDYYLDDELFTKGSSLNIKSSFIIKKVNSVLNIINSVVIYLFGSLGILISVIMSNSLLLIPFGVITIFAIIALFKKLF